MFASNHFRFTKQNKNNLKNKLKLEEEEIKIFICILDLTTCAYVKYDLNLLLCFWMSNLEEKKMRIYRELRDDLFKHYGR